MRPLRSGSLQRGAVRDGRLVFGGPGGLGRALADGMFRLAVPDGLDTAPGTLFCHEFHHEPAGDDRDPYRGFRHRPDVYFDRENFQTEHVLADRDGRERYFPAAVRETAERMNALALIVLRDSLSHLDIEPELWPAVTGDAVRDRGTHWFAANHYRPERDQLGCAPHKDTGFVTVLHIEQTGLEAATDDGWVPIEPSPGEFLVNFGGAFELLTGALPTPVRAVLHRVRRCPPGPRATDRVSFAAFVNPPPVGNLYRMRDRGTVEIVQPVAEFLREFNAETWNDRHAEFGISTGGAAR